VDDAELVERARDGDRSAFGALVDRHQRAVYHAALAALGSHAEAEDAAQDAFVTAFKRLASFRGDASFKTWLLTIAWRRAINRRRAAGRWWRRTGIRTAHDPQDDGGPLEVRSPAPSPEEAMAADRLRRDLIREIRALPKKLRDALLLAQTGEHSYQEIGAMLGTPVGTIKWRVSEARRVVRERLRALGYADVGSR